MTEDALSFFPTPIPTEGAIDHQGRRKDGCSRAAKTSGVRNEFHRCNPNKISGKSGSILPGKEIFTGPGCYIPGCGLRYKLDSYCDDHFQAEMRVRFTDIDWGAL